MKRIIFLCSLLCMLIMLNGCSTKTLNLEKDTYFISGSGTQMEAVLLLKADGGYILESGDSRDEGTYSLKDGVISYTSERGGEFEHLLYKDRYVLHGAYEGEIPDGSAFSATVTYESRGGGVIMNFAEDGKVTRQIYITNVSDQRIIGMYTREGDVISCNYGMYGKTQYIIKDGQLFDAYELSEDYVPPEPTGSSSEELTGTPVPSSEEGGN